MRIDYIERDKKHTLLMQNFIENYTRITRHMEPRQQNDFARLAPLVFAKWLTTALAPDTVLTPENIVAQDMEDTETHVYSYSLCTKKTSDGAYQNNFSPLSYSVESHPMIDDLRFLMDFCLPDCAMDENLFFIPEDRDFLLQKLSLHFDFYLEYLTRLAWWLGLLVRLPSIHANRAQRAPICETFFQQSNEDLLEQITDATCELAAERISVSMDLDLGVATASFFKDCLLHKNETDQIFIEFYHRVDIDIETLWDKSPDTLSEEDKAIVSSFLFTGIMIDKWFLFPLSAFLHVIKPMSFTPMRFHSLVNNMSTLLVLQQNVESEVLTPPTYYALTPIGKTILHRSETEEDKYTLPAAFSYEEIEQFAEQERLAHSVEDVYLKSMTKEIIVMRIYPQATPELWKIIETTPRMQADDFCLDIFAAFHMDEVEDYIFSIPDENGFPMDYSPSHSKRSINKTIGKTLGKLHLRAGTTLTLTPSMIKTEALTIEILDLPKGNPFVLYPRIREQSAELTELENIDDLF